MRRYLLLLLLGVSASAHAEATVAQVLATCNRALAQEFKGIEAAMCEWYVRPCGVCGLERPTTSPWCVPSEVTTAELAALVSTELRAEHTPQLPAKEAINALLTQRYPCSK